MLGIGALHHLFYIIMFSPEGLFKKVQCPEGTHCYLPNCIFAHIDFGQKLKAEDKSTDFAAPNNVSQEQQQANPDEPRKRRRIEINTGFDQKNDRESMARNSPPATVTLPGTASRSISPPPLRRIGKREEHTFPPSGISSTNSATLNGKSEAAALTLNPRMLPNPPASHAVRMQLTKMLHDCMLRLNEEIKESDDSSKGAVELSREELIMAALSEEEAAAKNNPSIYANVMKLRIVKLKKMKVLEWKEESLERIARQTPLSAHIEPKALPTVIDTGLKPSQEIAFLPRLVAKQNGLARHGYVPKPPSKEEVAQAGQGLDTAQGWEQCDRCKTRFQVFPGRREDGTLTSGGHCTYHPAKPRRPVPKNKADKVSKEPIFTCCNENVGMSPGCAMAPSHVFKVSDPKRLALIMPFEETPVNAQAAANQSAICFDCEMAYTTLGLELIRLTATSWPNGDELVDFLVRPTGEILDLNSQFSGVWPSDFANASPYNHDATKVPTTSKDGELAPPTLPVVESPMAARALLFSHLTSSTPLIGHALDNDLNATRIIHPSIIDTVLLYPHPRGLPIRFGLKVLMKQHLNRDIQMGGAQGHDSKEDARAAGDLVRLRVAEMWKRMKAEGWRVQGDGFLPPLTKAEAMKADIVKVKAEAVESKI